MCAFSSGHLIASVSSKSLNRFLVNFQMKNDIIPRAAIPPATDRPIIDPVLSPLLSSLLLLELSAPSVEEGEADEDVLLSVPVNVCVIVVAPPGPVDTTTDSEAWVFCACVVVALDLELCCEEVVVVDVGVVVGPVVDGVDVGVVVGAVVDGLVVGLVVDVVVGVVADVEVVCEVAEVSPVELPVSITGSALCSCTALAE